jgi:HK97 family phage prohead protease
VSDIEYGARVRVTEIKSDDAGYEVAGYVSTYGNVDHGGDAVMRGAFDSNLANKSAVRFLFAHDSHQVLGLPLELKSDDTGLFGRFKISQTQLGRDVHTLLKDGALDSFSIGYIPTDVEYDESGSRLLKAVDLLECSVVAMPMNTRALVTAVKGDADDDDESKAVWNTAYVNDLPDSAFALVYKDDKGTKIRKLPHHDKGGSVDKSHLRNALSRAPQMTDVSDAQRSRAVSHLRRHTGSDSKSDLPLDENTSFENLLVQVGEHLDIAAEAAEALQARRAEVGRKLAESHIDAINELLNKAEAAFERLDQIAALPPASTKEEDDGGKQLRLELARRLEAWRALMETT